MVMGDAVGLGQGLLEALRLKSSGKRPFTILNGVSGALQPVSFSAASSQLPALLFSCLHPLPYIGCHTPQHHLRCTWWFFIPFIVLIIVLSQPSTTMSQHGSTKFYLVVNVLPVPLDKCGIECGSLIWSAWISYSASFKSGCALVG